jgi:hypothetical protein
MQRRRPRKVAFEPLEPRVVLSTYVVSPAGNDSAAGTDQAPWLTLQKAANAVRPGDTVLVRAGRYAGFDLRTDGTSAAPIVFRADPGAVIDRPNARTSDGINLEGADYITIEGFRVEGIPRAGIRSVTNSHVTIRGNVADRNGVWGIFTGFSEDLLIEGNVTTNSQTQHGIYVSNSADRPVIRGNVVRDNYAAGIHMNGDISQGGDGIISGAIVEGNIVSGNGRGGGSGINADGVQNSRFQNNLVYDTHASGLSLYRIDGGGGSSGNVVVNNTILVASDGRWALNIRDASTGNTVRNNILYNAGSYRGSITITPDSLPGLVSDYNVVMDRFTTDDGDTRLTLAQWRSQTGQDTHSLIATPAALFVNPSAADFHLSATSPAIDRGTSAGAPTRDLEGRTRPLGGGWDIGAYEYASTTSNRPPVAVADSATTAEDSAVDVNVLANDSDPDGDAVSLLSITTPAHGQAAIVAGRVRYTPAANYSGPDSFTYTAGDGRGGTATATVTINVSAVNDPPTVGSLAASPATATQGTPVSLVANGVGDVDGTVASVAFYRDTNLNGVLDPAADLLLGTDASSAGGWSLALNTGNLAPGAYTLFARATDNAGAPGNVASATLTITTPAPPAARVIDDGDAGYQEVGGWRARTSTGAYGGDYRITYDVDSSTKATWRFDGLAAGTYAVYATWLAGGDRSRAVPYALYGSGSTPLAQVKINQRKAPADLTADGRTWGYLGTVTIGAGELRVVLGSAKGYGAVADAVRIEARPPGGSSLRATSSGPSTGRRIFAPVVDALPSIADRPGRGRARAIRLARPTA